MNTAILNLKSTKADEKYSMLIHTSGATTDHDKDYKVILDFFDSLYDKGNKYDSHIKCIYEDALSKTDSNTTTTEITRFIIENIGNKIIAVINHEKRFDIDPTKPPALFTIFIGGNKVSRGVTFENLLSMFFTRDVKHKLQQDTYIQRARMFGNRKELLKHFDLWIPKNLYNDWNRCFAYHKLAIKMIEHEKVAPIWIGDNRIQTASLSSIDKSTVNIDHGEISFQLFNWNNEIENIIKSDFSLQTLKKLHQISNESILPAYILNFINESSSKDINIKIRNVDSMSDYHEVLLRKRGVFGGTDIFTTHNFLILKNTLGKGRVVYRFDGKDVKSIKILKNSKNRI